MSPTSQDPTQLLTQLEALKSRFDSGNGAVIAKVLARLAGLPLDARQLIRFHETLLFLRAFPHEPSLVARVERLLNTFYRRIEKLRAANAGMSLFDDFASPTSAEPITFTPGPRQEATLSTLLDQLLAWSGALVITLTILILSIIARFVVSALNPGGRR